MRLEEYRLRLKREKCYFMQPSVEYLSCLIDDEGLHSTPEKVAAIVKALEPKSKTSILAGLSELLWQVYQ